MYKVKIRDHIHYAPYIDSRGCGNIYPYSMVQGFQKGDIFTDSVSALFWHSCGFSFLYGKKDESFLSSVYEVLFGSQNPLDKRSVLFIEDSSSEDFFRRRDDLILGKREFFAFQGDFSSHTPVLPNGYRLCEMDMPILEKLQGRITPRFSWEDPEDFLAKGKGWCVMEGNTPAAWAFSAAVSNTETDIGIETDSRYYRLGLAYIAAKQMIQHCLHEHKKPVWACHSQNIASRKLAEKLGFVKTAECRTVSRKR